VAIAVNELEGYHEEEGEGEEGGKLVAGGEGLRLATRGGRQQADVSRRISKQQDEQRRAIERGASERARNDRFSPKSVG
jgi:hypothetical protein